VTFPGAARTETQDARLAAKKMPANSLEVTRKDGLEMREFILPSEMENAEARPDGEDWEMLTRSCVECRLQMLRVLAVAFRCILCAMVSVRVLFA